MANPTVPGAGAAQVDALSSTEQNPGVRQVALHLCFAACVALLGLKLHPSLSWPFIMVATIAWLVAIGIQVVGHPLGVLIDSRNRMSLSRAQLVLWTVIVLSAFAAAALWNVARGIEDPLAIAVPEELWILVGISTASLVGSPLLLKVKEDRPNAEPLHQRASPALATPLDLVKGEEESNCAHVDLPRVQMGYFTLLVAVCYCAALGRLFASLDVSPDDEQLTARGAISHLPSVQSGLLALMGVSHTGYLAAKPISSQGHDAGPAKNPSPFEPPKHSA